MAKDLQKETVMEETGRPDDAGGGVCRTSKLLLDEQIPDSN
ncbi:hypothetical protein ACLI07_23235 (plasmid) [Providencia huaxiensis]|uniref:Uncharacterized protein n=2 Tax=Providencia TaxID=586 RepID=A0AA42JZ52_9GAMM|nr:MULTISPECIES: hypothetical protein [Providencia]MDG4696049.1 hypothetical protein [Providencia sp. CRE-3FA-0001]MDI9095068.1 hypothetical protein [Providencia rettgeri]